MKLHASYMTIKVLAEVLVKPIPKIFSQEEQKLPSLSQVTNPQLGSGIQNQIDTITR